MKIIFIWTFYFLSTFSSEAAAEEDFTVYVSRNNWHTGIIIKTELIKNELRELFPNLIEYEWIDIGWGDEEFYQSEGFNSELAFKALFINTPSVLRIEGIIIPINKYLSYTDSYIKINLSENNFNNLINFIFSSLRIENEKPILKSSLAEKIFFYSSSLNYNAFYTCNTWIAEGLKNADFPINPFLILTSQKLFSEINKALRFGRINFQPDNSDNN